MSSFNSISVEKLSRLVGTPSCPMLLDVRTGDDFATNPRFVPGAKRYSWERVGEWAPFFAGRSVIVMCHRGKKLSEGAAAWLRQSGSDAESLEGGTEAWVQAQLPMVVSTVSRDARHKVDGTDMGFKPVLRLSAEQASTPAQSSCQMKRPG